MIFGAKGVLPSVDIFGSSRRVFAFLAFVFFVLLSALSGKLWLDSEIAIIQTRLQNERNRLSIGEEILHRARELERDMYRLSSISNGKGREMVLSNMRHHREKIDEAVSVIKNGGRVVRNLASNVPGVQEVETVVEYSPHGDDGVAMEYIELPGLLETVMAKADELKNMSESMSSIKEMKKFAEFAEKSDELDIFMKMLPGHFSRLSENVSRLFLVAGERLSVLEKESAEKRSQLKMAEMYAALSLLLLIALSFASFVHQAKKSVAESRRSEEVLSELNSELSAALEQAENEKCKAEESAKVKTEFVSRMSHELRTPLNAIIGFSELLASKNDLPHEDGEYVKLIGSSGKHLLSLVNDVLDFAKLESGKMEVERTVFSPWKEMMSVKSMMYPKAIEKGVSLVMSQSGPVPSRVIGDPTKFRQILINLVGNAIKFTSVGVVSVGFSSSGDTMLIEIEDTGVGMSEDTMARMFRPFAQADSSVTRKYGGTGLGLLISKELAEIMHGSLDVKSVFGKGSVFVLTLPFEPVAEDDAYSSPSVGEASLAPLIGGRVLLVDDNAINRRVAGAMLKKLGFDWDEAVNGEEAVKLAVTGRYRMVLMDVEMPVMDGLSATAKIREWESRTAIRNPLKIIAVTANVAIQDKEKYMNHGMDGFVGKPVSMSSLQKELLDDSNVQDGLADMVSRQEESFSFGQTLEMMGGDHDLFVEIANGFVAAAKGHERNLMNFVSAGDMENLRRELHTLKGLFGTFSATDAEAAARKAEFAVKEGDSPEALVSEVVRLLNLLEKDLSKRIASS